MCHAQVCRFIDFIEFFALTLSVIQFSNSFHPCGSLPLPELAQKSRKGQRSVLFIAYPFAVRPAAELMMRKSYNPRETAGRGRRLVGVMIDC